MRRNVAQLFAAQPQYTVRLDLSNRFGARVLYAQLGSIPGRLICRDQPDILFTTNNATSGVNQSGKCLQTANASNSYAATANQSLFGGRSALSCFAIWSYSAQQSTADIIRKNSEFTPVQLISANSARAAMWRGGLNTTGSIAVAANTEYRSLTRWKTGSNLEFFITPSSSASSGVVGGVSDTSASAPLIFGAAENNTEWAATLQPLTIFFDSWISDAEYLDLRANPWQVFKAPARRLRAVSSGGGSTYNVSIAESASASDSPSASYIAAASIAESGSAADTPDGQIIRVADITESATAAESASASQITTAIIVEAGNAADALSASGVFAAAIVESGSASDLSNWGGAIYAVSVAESASAADSAGAQADFSATVAESANAGDSSGVQVAFVAAITEAAAAVDGVAVSWVAGAAVVEAATAADLVNFVAAIAFILGNENIYRLATRRTAWQMDSRATAWQMASRPTAWQLTH